MSWIWYALLASIMWGLSYIINQITLNFFSAIELLLFEALIVVITLGGYLIGTSNLGTFLGKLSDFKQLSLIVLSSWIYLVASLLIYKSISYSNASLASIIESSYPFFTVFFAYIILGQEHLNFKSALGFILMFCGIVIVKLYSHE